MRFLPALRTAIVLTLACCLLAASLGPINVVDDVVETIDVQAAAQPIADDALIVPSAAQPQPSADDYDTRLYRADLARAKRWGS